VVFRPACQPRCLPRVSRPQHSIRPDPHLIQMLEQRAPTRDVRMWHPACLPSVRAGRHPGMRHAGLGRVLSDLACVSSYPQCDRGRNRASDRDMVAQRRGPGCKDSGSWCCCQTAREDTKNMRLGGQSRRSLVGRLELQKRMQLNGTGRSRSAGETRSKGGRTLASFRGILRRQAKQML
jgi:hypothetical protein